MDSGCRHERYRKERDSRKCQVSPKVTYLSCLLGRELRSIGYRADIGGDLGGRFKDKRNTAGHTMPEYLFLMHSDATTPEETDMWPEYLDRLQRAGVLRGGSAIGPGLCARKSGAVPETADYLVGYVKTDARDMSHAR